MAGIFPLRNGGPAVAFDGPHRTSSEPGVCRQFGKDSHEHRGLWNVLGHWIDADRHRSLDARLRPGNGNYLGIVRLSGIAYPLAGPYSATAQYSSRTHCLMGTAIMLAGIAISARAGVLRDAARKQTREASGRTSFRAGFFVCCLSGLLSSALNFSYAFGGEAVRHAVEFGTSSLWAAGVVTALAVSGGFVVNLFYCGYLLWKNRTLHKFAGVGAGTGWLCGGLMGMFWFGGQALYGVGVSHMGSLGVVIGWPLLMGMIIVTSNWQASLPENGTEFQLPASASWPEAW